MLALRAVLVVLIVPGVWLAMYLLTAGVPLNAPPAPWRQAILRPLLRFWADVLLWLGFGFWGWRVQGAARVWVPESLIRMHAGKHGLACSQRCHRFV